MNQRSLIMVVPFLLAPAIAMADEPVAAPVAAPVAEAPAAEATAEAPAPTVADATATDPAADPAATAPATTEAAPEAVAETTAQPSTLAVNAFASTSYSFNFNRPEGGTNQLRVFDFDDNSARIDVVELVLQYPAGDPGSVGFRVDMVAGAGVPKVEASAGLFRDPMGVAQDFDLQQAFVTYLAKDGKLRFDVGKFITHMGYEVIEGYDGYNDNYSRSFLFGYAIPFTHTGLKVGYAVSDKVGLSVMLVNGADNVRDNNARPSVCAQVTFVASPKLTLWLNYMGGPEQTGNNDNLRHGIDLVAIVKPADKVTIGVNGDFATEAEAAAGETATWYGAALYGRFDVSDSFALSLRGEYFVDDDGVRTGTPQTLTEVTLTPAWKVASALVVRGDLRFDHSDEKVFVTDDMAEPSANQITAAVNVIAVY